MAGGINQKVVTWAHGKLKQRVGRGECWDLADRALRQAGAQSSTTMGANDDYVWGKEVPITTVVPGDILQFRDYVVNTVSTTEVTFVDGSSTTDVETTLAKRPHHTAIVAAVSSRSLTVFEQQVKPDEPHVQQHDLPIAGGTMTTVAQRMLATKSGAKKLAAVVTTFTVTISGRIWAYRPKASNGN
jgi:hypothetical protein